MAQIQVGEVSLEVATFGPEAGEAVLLIMGLGLAHTAWPKELVMRLAEAGYWVILFDNRDSGRSSRAVGTAPHPAWVTAQRWMGLRPHLPYDLSDMATDALGVLDVLAVEKAHLVGMSMGGMIAQVVASHDPDRVLSLTSIMASSGAAHLPLPDPRALHALLSRPRTGGSFEALVDHFVHTFAVIGSPAFPTDPERARSRLREVLSGGYDAAGAARQMAAVVASGDRSTELRKIRVPTLVIHGESDPLVPVAAGRDTAAKIPGASFVGIEGMGHDLPDALVPSIAQSMLDHFVKARAAR